MAGDRDEPTRLVEEIRKIEGDRGPTGGSRGRPC